jgi:hypothetical protein
VRSTQGGDQSGVQAVRMLLGGLAVAIVMIGIVLGVAFTTDGHLRVGQLRSPSATVITIALVVIGVGFLAAGTRLERPLDISSERALVASYRSRFFLWIGLCETPAFLGIAAAVATGRFWLYLVGSVFAFIGYARISPTAGHLRRDQQSIDHRGSSLVLVAALDAMNKRGRGWSSTP